MKKRKGKGIVVQYHVYKKPKMMGWLFLLAIFAEIAGFIIVGKAVGLFATLALLAFCMVLGVVLLRFLGFSLLASMQRELAAGRIPSEQIADKALMMLAALLLIIPGFVSDIMGLLLLIAPIRNFVWLYFTKRFKNNFQPNYNSYDRYNQSKSQNGDKIVDLDNEDYHQDNKDDNAHKKLKNESPWKH